MSGPQISQAEAETIALQALAWLAGQEDLLGAYMANSGVGLDVLRAGAADLDILGSVFDFILTRDEWVLAFCEAQGYAPERFVAATQALPGGAQVHWT